MIGMRRLSVLPIILLLVASCDFLRANDVDFRQRAVDETLRREALWKAQAIHHYDFEFLRSCACDQVAQQPVTIHVRNDVITRVVGSTGADVAPVTGVPWPTVDSLFLWTKLLLNDKSFAVEVGFDSTLSFPNHIKAENTQRVSLQHSAFNLVVQTATAPIIASRRIPARTPLTRTRVGSP
jgi:hypothetical protein